MIVEFIGSTGAGKTTIIKQVRRSLGQKEHVSTAFELVAQQIGLSRVPSLTIQHVLQEVFGFPYFLGSLNRHGGFISFVWGMLARQAGFSLLTINNLRSLERKLGAYEMLQRTGRGRIVLVDEGTVHIAHNVFVYTNTEYSREEIARFASLVPLPEMIVYVKAPKEILIQRSLQRPDPPREIKTKDPALVEKYVGRASNMFDQLVEAENIQSRLVAVEHAELVEQGIDAVIDRITNAILSRKIAGHPVYPANRLAHIL